MIRGAAAARRGIERQPAEAGEVDLRPGVGVLLSDAGDAVAVRLGGVALDIARGQPGNAGEHGERTGKGRAVAALFLEQEPGDEVARERWLALVEGIRKAALQIQAQRAGTVEGVGGGRGDLLRDLKDRGLDRGGQLQIGGPDRLEIRIGFVIRGEHGLADAVRGRVDQAAGEGIAVPGGQAARGKDLAGGRKVADDAVALGREEALGQKERAGGVRAHDDLERAGGGQHGKDGFFRTVLVKEIAAQLGKARIDEQIAAARGGICPGQAGVLVFDRGAKQRAARRFDLHDGIVRGRSRAAQTLLPQRLIAGGGEGKRGAGIGEEEIIPDGLLDAQGEGVQRGHGTPGQRHAQQRERENQRGHGQKARGADAARPADEYQRGEQGDERQGIDAKAQQRDDEQLEHGEEGQREERLIAAGEGRADAGEQNREQRRERTRIGGQREGLAV